tara:strand:- start:441 stop:614 length:174 start_codon:yes stop_codon:yes gene_type:complete
MLLISPFLGGLATVCISLEERRDKPGSTKDYGVCADMAKIRGEAIKDAARFVRVSTV